MRFSMQVIEEGLPWEIGQLVGKAALKGKEAKAKAQAECDPGSSSGAMLEPTASSGVSYKSPERVA